MAISAIRPNDYVYALLSSLSYKDDGGKIEKNKYPELNDWQINSTQHVESNGLFVVAYVNEKTKNVVFAFRGTDFTKWQAIKTDLQGIVRGKLTAQQSSGYAFVKDTIQKLNLQGETEYRISFTGHSLGGWLAAGMLWQFAKILDQNINPVSAVTYDAPGVLPIIEAMEQMDQGQVRAIEIDLKNLMGPPNIVNIINRKLGENIHVLASSDANDSIDDLNFLTKSLPAVFTTMLEHKLNIIMERFGNSKDYFPPEVLAVVSKWPESRSELESYYKVVYEQARKTNLKMNALSYEEYFNMTQGTHYQPTAYDVNKIALIHFDPIVAETLDYMFSQREALKHDVHIRNLFNSAGIPFEKLIRQYTILPAEPIKQHGKILIINDGSRGEKFREMITELLYKNEEIITYLQQLKTGRQLGEHIINTNTRIAALEAREQAPQPLGYEVVGVEEANRTKLEKIQLDSNPKNIYEKMLAVKNTGINLREVHLGKANDCQIGLITNGETQQTTQEVLPPQQSMSKEFSLT